MRIIPSPVQLQQLVIHALSIAFATGQKFTHYTLTKTLRQTNANIEVTHEQVREAVRSVVASGKFMLVVEVRGPGSTVLEKIEIDLMKDWTTEMQDWEGQQALTYVPPEKKSRLTAADASRIFAEAMKEVQDELNKPKNGPVDPFAAYTPPRSFEDGFPNPPRNEYQRSLDELLKRR